MGQAVCHLMTGSYPPGSFYLLADGVLVSSPELTFLQMATVLDEDLLVAYGYELCGFYSRKLGGVGFCNCPSVTSVARIGSYLDRLERLRLSRGEGMPHGVRRARRALAQVRDRAASPEEAVVSMVLTLPRCRGGYGLPAARLNERVRLSAKAAELFGIQSFVCDLSWNDGRQVLEYQGAQHKARSRGSYDMRKGNVLTADGRSVLQMDRFMLGRRDRMDEVARTLFKALGLRWRRPDTKLATRQIRLRNKLLRDLEGR